MLNFDELLSEFLENVYKMENINLYIIMCINVCQIHTNIRQRGREPSEKVKLTTAQEPPQGASGAPCRGRSARSHNPTNNQPTN